MKKTLTQNENRRPVEKALGKILIFLSFFLLPAFTFAQQTYTFTTCGATGRYGPTQVQANTAYLTTNLNGSVTIVSGGIQTWTVPVTGNYEITTTGASGGCDGQAYGGRGAQMRGTFSLTAGAVLKILVGQKGGDGYNYGTGSDGGGGGGGSFVTTLANTPLIIGGGGGGKPDPIPTPYPTQMDAVLTTTGGNTNATLGGGTAGNGGNNGITNGPAAGGGGLLTNGVASGGSTGGLAFINGGDGGADMGSTYAGGVGGYGGGGGGWHNSLDRCGGGGGYSGGQGGTWTPITTDMLGAGGGGASYNSGISQVNTASLGLGQGTVTIRSLCFISLSASTTNSLAPAICSGTSLTLTTNAASSYTWSTGNTTNNSIVVTPATTTTYSVAGTSTANCFAVNYITVTVSPGVPVLSIASSSNNLCLGKSATLTASGALTYTWTGGITNGVGFIPLTTTNYTVSGQNGCGISTAVTSITVAPLPVTAIVTPTTMCAGSTATLNAASAVTGYTWFPGPLIGGSVVVGPVATTVYTVVASDGTCSGTAFVNLPTLPVPTLAVVASSTLVCEGSPVTLTASGAASYSWTTPANTTGSVITVNPNGPTLYQVVGTNAVGCTSPQSQIVLTNSSPTVNITTNKTIACPGDAVNLLAGGSGATSYAWTNGPGTAAYNVNPAFTTAYVVTGTGLGCTTSKTITIAVVNASVNAVTSNTGICNGGSATLTASGANSYLWVGFVPGASAIVTPTASTMYTVNAVTTASSISCPSSANINITVFSNPTVSIAATKTVMCKPDSGPKLTASGAVTYTWSNNATTSTVNVAPTITASTYTVTGTDANGCVNSSVITIKVNTCTGINGIAVNDKALVVYPNPSNGEFTITGDSDITLKIVNELGQEVSNIKLSAQNDYKVSVTNLANGIYFIVGQNENGAVNQKIVVSK